MKKIERAVDAVRTGRVFHVRLMSLRHGYYIYKRVYSIGRVRGRTTCAT